MADIQYDPACMDCRHDAVKDPAGTTWQCNGHVRAERDWLRARLANVLAESEDADRSAAAWKRTADELESEVARLRSDTYALTTERNAALTLAEQRGAAYDIEQALRVTAERERDEWKQIHAATAAELASERERRVIAQEALSRPAPPADAATEAVREVLRRCDEVLSWVKFEDGVPVEWPEAAVIASCRSRIERVLSTPAPAPSAPKVKP